MGLTHVNGYGNLIDSIGGPKKDTTHLQDYGTPSYSNISDLNNDDLIKPYSGRSLNISRVEDAKKISDVQRAEKQFVGNKLK